MKLLTAVALLAAAVALCEGKTFTLCGLVQELRRQRFPESQLRDWVCLIQRESGMRTHVIGGPNSNGSYDHGLYQINDRFWCNNGNTPGKDCNVTCAQLRTDDITRASNCAKIIYNRHGFNAWYGWVNFCRGKPLPSISHC